MLKLILSLTLFLIFISLSGLHFFWLFGGTWGLSKAIPSKSRESKKISIPPIATLIVASILLFCALIYLVNTGLLNLSLPKWMRYGYWLIPIAFILRSIGDFNYVGFFKKIKDTEFAEADSKIFIPLCLAIGVVAILIQIL